VVIKKEGDRVEDGGMGGWGGRRGVFFGCLLKDSISRLLGNRVDVRLWLEWLVVMAGRGW